MKWQDKLAVKVAENAVIFKLLRDKEDSIYMRLYIHNDYFDVINDNWTQGWEPANSKTKHPKYKRCPYEIRFLEGNEENYTMREAKWGEKRADDDDDDDDDDEP